MDKDLMETLTELQEVFGSAIPADLLESLGITPEIIEGMPDDDSPKTFSPRLRGFQIGESGMAFIEFDQEDFSSPDCSAEGEEDEEADDDDLVISEELRSFEDEEKVHVVEAEDGIHIYL